MILELGKYERNALYFDCFLSSHDIEKEYLFLGGYAALKITTILHFMNDIDKIKNYADYLAIIECFVSIFQNKSFNEQRLLSNSRIDTLSILATNKRDNKLKEESIPEYISQLFSFRCNKMINLEIDLRQFKEISRILQVSMMFMNITHEIIDFNLLSQIFIKAQKVQIILPNDFIFSDNLVRYLYDNLYQESIRVSVPFKVIEFQYKSKWIPQIVHDLLASQLQDDFDNIGWAISVELNQDNDESIYFTKLQARRHTHYQPLSSALKVRSIESDSIHHIIR